MSGAILTCVSLNVQRNLPFRLMDARHSLGAERRYPPGEPRVDFLFDPPNGACGDLNSHREQAVPLQPVELGLLDPSSIDELLKPK